MAKPRARLVARRSPLQVWLYGAAVAELTNPGPGRITCQYRPEALQRWPLNTALLSCSLPLSRRPNRGAGAYFRGMLPEGAALQAMASEAKVASFDTFGLLARFGRDVAGAAIVAASDEEPRSGHVVEYTAQTLAEEVANLENRPLALYDDSELSLPGLQNKMLLVRTADGWARPAGGFPSTHILKAEDRRLPGMAKLEAGALALAREVGLTSVEASTETFDGIACVIVSRFDRVPEQSANPPPDAPTRSRRLHQEDVCQALGVDPELARGKGKYEASGRPSFADVAGLLDRFADDPAEQLNRLLAVATFTVAIGNADAHGKNLSLLHTTPGVVELAPLYDTVPTVLWPTLRDEAAMRVNGRPRLATVTLDDLVTEARSWNLGATIARRAVTETAERLSAAAHEMTLPVPLADLVAGRCKEILGG
jgi:serine/threonine-protein kinase HipA